MKSHEHFAPNAGVIRFPGPAGAGTKDPSDGRGAAMLNRNRPKPAWHVLYIVVAVIVPLFVVAEVKSPTGGWRTLTECLATLLIIGVMALWVRANRAALAVGDAIPCDGRAQENPAAYFPRQSAVPRLDSCPIEFRQRSRAQTGPAEEEEEDAKCFAK
ncbi:MAG: hypothetical protein ACHQ7N_07840 [Candidatus Methylomirabilales bacterium]